MSSISLRRLAPAALAIGGLLATTVGTQAASGAPDPRPDGPTPQHRFADVRHQGADQGQDAAPPPSRADGVLLYDCGRAGPSGQCGTLRVPLDRAHPRRATLTLFFLYYPARQAAPATEGIMMAAGGPGGSLTSDTYYRSQLRQTFDPLRDTRSLIQIDQRGVGGSQAISCRALQSNPDFTVQSIVAKTLRCAHQLGASATMYGSGDVAQDMEAVRQALGLKRLALFGGSYSTQDVQTYAARYPRRVSAAVLDSPVSADVFGSPGSPFDDYYTDESIALPRIADVLCARSGNCSADRDNARDDLGWLAQRLRTQPLTGSAPDADGISREVTITETTLAWTILQSGDNSLVALSEIAAAAQSLRAGDPAPLLRLGAEAAGRAEPSGDPERARDFSWGENAARFCTDVSDALPWDPTADLAERHRQWRGHVADLPDDRFGLFSKDGWLTRPGSPIAPDPCIAWPGAVDTTPSAVPGPLPASVPALVLGAELDQSIPVEDARAVAASWPGSDYVEIDGSQHGTFFWAPECARPLMVEFLSTHEVGDTSCARTTPDLYSYPGVGRFARTAADTDEPTAVGGDASTPADRHVAAATSWAVTDAARRGLSYGPATGVGLRGGSFTLSFGSNRSTQELTGVRFTDDVAVSGTSHYSYSAQRLAATVSVDGPGDEDGELTVQGVWYGFRVPTTVLRVTGTIGGRAVAVTLPAS